MRVASLRHTPVLVLVATLVAGTALLAPAGPTAVAAPATAPATAPARVTAPAPPLDIVVLGDSYSAGNGATDDAGQPQTYGPADCYRSRVGWAEKYAAALRSQGRTVHLANHACSGGTAVDIVAPREMDTASSSTDNKDGVTTLAQADAYLAAQDLCNTRRFPREEFWTYHATAVDDATIDYDCTRRLRPQAQFVTAGTDLVLFTMGGNDAGFTDIVTQCFILKSGPGCQGTIDTARSLLPQIKQQLLDDVAGLRAAGLRDDARIVQLGYPYLQLDNGYTAVGVPPYAAGDAVRSLIDDGTAALASVPADANVGHPGQMVFVGGVTEAFAGHEPDATTPVGNLDRWVNQAGDGTNTSLWYHPNRLGQTAYAAVLLRGGDYGATPAAVVRTTLRARSVRRSYLAGGVVRVRTTVTRSDGTRPRGRVLLRSRGQVVSTARVAASGRNVLRVEGLRPGPHRVRAVYVDQQQRRKAVVVTVRVRRG
ncbi:hypothetical protein [Nocardioides rubriscoriae]|uniref:hypothetical protein n=1 Tax=Nocardioides rubriscoriae TaxID=642762 RepID=UPI0011DF6063|nr:hypothetical protein [Nocardioides rubriscoriae]